MSTRRARLPVELPSVPREQALALVDARLSHCKDRVSLAALACLRGAQDAAVLVRQALDEIERARDLLAQAETPDG